MKDDGFSKSYRSKWENPIFRNLLEAGIWAWMCDTAAWKECRVRYKGEVVNLKRGQLVTSRRFISQGFCIGEQVTRTFLDHLENDGMINQQPTHSGTIITICNYEKYQAKENQDNPQTNPRVTHDQPTGNPNKKEDKNLRKEESTALLAREASAEKSAFQKIYDAGCAVCPALATANTSAIHAWIAAGVDAELDAIPEITRLATGKPSIRGWNYFTGAVLDAHATRTTPLPKGTPNVRAYSNKSKSTGDILREQIEATRAEREQRSTGQT